MSRSSTALAFLTVTAAACPSRAQEVIAVDNAAVESRGNWGFGADLRVGFRTGLPRNVPLIGAFYGLILQPEIIGGYRQLFVDTGDLHLGRIGGGLRAGGSIYWFQPLVFVHVSAADANGSWGTIVDVGLALDVRYRSWSWGVHGVHDFMHLDTGWTHLNELGAHVEFRAFWL